MLKRIIGQDTQDVSPSIHHWLNVDALAQVEVTSEDAAHPIESGLVPGTESGWRAAQPGPQTHNRRGLGLILLGHFNLGKAALNKSS